MSEKKLIGMDDAVTCYFITGASRGLGLEFVRQISESAGNSRVHIYAACRDPKKATQLQDLAKQAASASSGAVVVEPIKLEITSDEEAKAVVDHLTSAGAHIDVLIHNAGVIENDPNSSMATTSREEALHIYNVNAVSPMLLTQKLLPFLTRPRSAGAGSSARARLLAFVSSDFGSIGKASFPMVPAYRMSKAAMNMLAKLMAIELALPAADSSSSSSASAASAATKVAVACLHPGWVDTDMGSRGGRKPPVTPQDSVGGMLAQMDKIRQSSSSTGKAGAAAGADAGEGAGAGEGGMDLKLISYDGTEVPW